MFDVFVDGEKIGRVSGMGELPDVVVASQSHGGLFDAPMRAYFGNWLFDVDEDGVKLRELVYDLPAGGEVLEQYEDERRDNMTEDEARAYVAYAHDVYERLVKFVEVVA